MDLVEQLKRFNERRAATDPIGVNSLVLLVDAMNTYIRNFCAVPTMNDTGEHVGGVTGFLKSVGQAARLYVPTRIICVFDGAGGSQRRRKLFEGYKDNRRPMEHLNRTYNFKDKEAEQAALKWQMHLLVELLEHLPVNTLAIDNIEADDAIAYLVQLVREAGGKSTILSTDKDFLQLVDKSCEVFNPVKKKLYTPELVVEEYGIHPKNFLLARIVEGDKSDNIPGVNGVGEATLLKLFPYLKDAIPADIDTLLESCKRELTVETGKRVKKTKTPVACLKLSQAKDDGIIERNRQLMDLANVDISGTAKIKIGDALRDTPHALNKYDLTKKMNEFRLLSAFGNYDEWLLTSWVPLTRYCKE